MGRPKGGKNVMRTPEEKEKILLEYLINHKSLTEISSKYNINLRLLKKWKSKYLENGIDGLQSQSGKQSKGRPKKLVTREEELELKIMKLEIENERLKKGYIVKGDGAAREYVTTLDKNTK